MSLRKNSTRIRNRTADVKVCSKIETNSPADKHKEELTGKHETNQWSSFLALFLGPDQDILIFSQELVCCSKGNDGFDAPKCIFGNSTAFRVFFEKSRLDFLIAANNATD